MAGHSMHGYHHLQVFLSKTKQNTRKALCAIAFTDAHPLSGLQVLRIQRAEDVLSSSSQLSLSANTNKAGLPLFFFCPFKDKEIFSTTANSKQFVSLFLHRTLQSKRQKERYTLNSTMTVFQDKKTEVAKNTPQCFYSKSILTNISFLHVFSETDSAHFPLHKPHGIFFCRSSILRIFS